MPKTEKDTTLIASFPNSHTELRGYPVDGATVLRRKDARDVTSKAMGLGNALFVTEPFNASVLKDDVLALGLGELEANDILEKTEIALKALKNSGVLSFSASLIRSIANDVMRAMGITKQINDGKIHIDIQDYRDIVFNTTKDNANFLTNNPEMVAFSLHERINKNLVTQTPFIFDDEVRRAHNESRLYLHDSGQPFRFYCLHGDNIVWTNRYGSTTIRDLVLNYSDTRPEFEGKEKIVINVSDQDIFMDDNSKVIRLMINKTKKNILKIILKNNRQLLVTKDHRIIMEDGSEKMASDICVGDLLMPIKEYLEPEQKCETIDVIQAMVDSNVSSGVWVLLSKSQAEEFCIGSDWVISKNCEYYKKRLSDYLVSDLYKKFNPVVLLTSVDNGKYMGVKSSVVVDRHFLYLLGLYIADGCNNYSKVSRSYQWDIACAVEEYRKHIKSLIKIVFGNIYIYENTDRLKCCNLVLYHLFNFLGVGSVAGDKKIPAMFSGHDNNMIILRGAFDGDGCFSSYEITYATKSELLMNDISRALSLYGISHRVDTNDTSGCFIFRISGSKNIARFSSYIGFSYLHKVDALKGYLANVRGLDSRRVDNTVKSVGWLDGEHEVFDIETSTGTIPISSVSVHNCHALSLVYIGKFGLDLPTVTTTSAPAKHADVLLGHLKTYLVTYQSYFSGALGIPYFNIFFAPYLVGMKHKEIKQLCQKIAFGLAQTAFGRGTQSVFIDMNINAHVPHYLAKTKAVGPGGEHIYDKKKGRHLTYKDFEHEAQLMAKYLIEAWKEGDRDGNIFPFPKLIVHVDEECFTMDSAKDILTKACDLTKENGSAYYVFDRHKTASVSMCCRLSFQHDRVKKYMLADPEKMRFVAAQNVSINIPRAAYAAKSKHSKSNSKSILYYMLQELNEVMDIAFKAHAQKRDAFAKYMTKGGPLYDTSKSWDGLPYVDLDSASWLIGVIGLNNAVQHLCGSQIHESEDAFDLGMQIIQFMNNKCKASKELYGLDTVLEETPGETACSTLAQNDYNQLKDSVPNIQNVMRGEQGYFYYESGAQLEEGSAGMLDRFKYQSEFSPHIPAGSIIHVWLGESQPPVESVLNVIEKIFRSTKAREVTFTPDIAVCPDNHVNIWNRSDVCPVCGKEIEYYMSRIVGYFARVDRWHQGKKFEFEKRKREGL